MFVWEFRSILDDMLEEDTIDVSYWCDEMRTQGKGYFATRRLETEDLYFEKKRLVIDPEKHC